MVRAKSQVPGQGSQGLRPESDVWTGEPNLEGFPTSLRFHLLSAETVSSLSAWILMTRSQFSFPLRIRFLEANQPITIVPGVRVAYLPSQTASGLSAWILMTRSQFSLPLRIRFLEANQRPLLASGSLPTSPT